MSMWRVHFIVAVAFVACVFIPARAAGGEDPESKTLSWLRMDGSLELRQGSETVWRFNFGADKSKPYFHPVAVPGVGTLTWEDPADHPWHHALWFSWKYINKVNYWEEDRRTGRAAGLTEITHVNAMPRADFSARFILDLAYHTPDAPPLMTERRTIDVYPPAEDGSYKMDWTCAFTAVSDALLDRTPVAAEKWETAAGGYAGLSLRFAAELKDCRAVDSDGKITEGKPRIRVKARAVDYSGLIGGKAAGVAILDHPENLNAPTPWYIINTGNDGMRFFSPAVIHNAPHLLEAGETMILRYRVIVHPGQLGKEALQRAVAVYTAP